MKFWWLTVIFCLCLLADETLGGKLWRRKPKIPKPVCKALCKGACAVAENFVKCPTCVIGCPPICKKICKRRRRRREEDDVVMYPCRFEEYDTNKDGFISPKEFMEALDFLSPEDVERIFKVIDINDDGRIDEVEFKAMISKLRPTNCY